MFQRCAALSLVALALIATGVSAQDTEALIDQGVEAFRRGDNVAATEAFKAALANNPSQAEAFQLWERAEQQELLEMLAAEGELGALAERFLGLARVGRRVVASDPGGARDVVVRLIDGNVRERQEALLELESVYGEWAVPALVGPLADRSDINRRVAAIQALIHLGDEAVVPLTQALQSDDELTRANVASVLGALGDVRAAPALAWTAQMDASETVRGNAREALDRLAPSLAAIDLATTDPMILTQGLVERWILGDPAVIRPYASTNVSWSWDGGAVVGTPILSGLYGLALADGTLRQALGMGAGDPLAAYLAAVLAAQAAEIEAASQIEGLADADLLAEARDGLPMIMRSLALAGPSRGPALQVLLDLRQVPASEVLLSTMGSSPPEVVALRAALTDANGTISLAAARTLAELGETDPAIVARLGHALTTVPDRLAMLIGDVGLGQAPGGWVALRSSNPAEGLLRAKAFPPKSVVVLRDGVGGVTLDAMVFGLKNDPRTAETPLMVVTDDVDGVEALYSDELALITDGTSWEDVADVAASPTAEHRAAMAQALGAAQSMAYLPAAAIRVASPEIVLALGSSLDDDVKAAILDLATKGEVTGATGAVEQTLVTGGSRELQLSALRAAARLWAATGGASQPSDELVTALQTALESDDEEIAMAAAEAIGQMGGDGPAGLLSLR